MNQSINTLNKYLISSYISQQASQVYLLSYTSFHLPKEVSQGSQDLFNISILKCIYFLTFYFLLPAAQQMC